MKSSVVSFVVAPLSMLVVACYATDPCGAGLMLQPDGTCVPMKAAAVTSTSDAGASDAGESDAAAAATSNFGKTCTAQTDCGGDAPVCAAPQLPYCTQISCQAGEANAGSCPSGFSCVSAGGQSACMKM